MSKIFISKKELLKLTGISYGQLYRWKRQKLIPEEWFIKRPSFTGQETYFPRDKILKRINAIQELKDKYSLEELSRILSPELADRNFTPEDLSIIEEIDKGLISCFVNSFAKNSFSYIEVVFMCGLSAAKRDCNLTIGEVEGIVKGLKDWVSSLTSTEFILVIYDDKRYSAIHPENVDVYMDKRLNIIKKIRLNEISSLIKMKYRKSFNFKFAEDGEEELNSDMQFSY